MAVEGMNEKTNSGFSLIELLIVLAILLVISGAVFQVVNLTTQRSNAEQTKLDMFQEGREFMDQMTRDARQAGYPNARNFAPSILNSTVQNDSRVAAGLVKIAAGELWFEADVDGTGVVSVIHYYIDTSISNNCPCLMRSQLDKVTGNALSGQTAPSPQVEVQGVTNTETGIFSGYFDGVAQTLPLDFNTNGATIAAIDTIQAVLSLEGAVIDPKTRTKPTTTLVTTVRLNNCSLAASARQSSCF